MTKHRTRTAVYVLSIAAYLGFIFYFLTIHPGGKNGSEQIILAVTALASGGMVMMAIYAIMLYTFRQGEKAALYFAMVCVCAGVRFFVLEGSRTITILFTDFPISALYVLRYVSIGFLIIGITGFINEVFKPVKKYRQIYQGLRVINVISYALYIAVVVTVSDDTPFMRLFLLLPTSAITAYGLFIIAKTPNFKRNRLNQLYFGAVFIYIGEVVLAGLLTERFPNVPVTTQTIFVIVHVIVLTNRYATAVNKNEYLDRLNRTKTEFLQDMSHEMKNPLTVIATGIDRADMEISISGGSIAEARAALESARDETQRLGRMVGGMVRLASVSESDENRRRVDFAAFLKHSAEAFRPLLKQRNNSLTEEIQDSLPDVFIEKDRFTQVIANILSNADDSMHGGMITLAADFDGKMITVRITDTGAGVEPELLPRIFERGVSGKGGTGYGLYICKTILEAHGGTIYIESTPGKGAAVTFTVPAYGGQEAGHG